MSEVGVTVVTVVPVRQKHNHKQNVNNNLYYRLQYFGMGIRGKVNILYIYTYYTIALQTRTRRVVPLSLNQ